MKTKRGLNGQIFFYRKILNDIIIAALKLTEADIKFKGIAGDMERAVNNPREDILNRDNVFALKRLLF